MSDHANNSSEDAPQSYESANEPGQSRRGLVPHPLFPRRDRTPEDRDIRFVTFLRRRADGRIEPCPEDIPAHEIQSWADVTTLWGGGEYQAIGKDQFRQEVAWNPARQDEWLLFDFESRPLMPRNGARHGASSHAFAPPYSPPMPAYGPPAPVQAQGMHGPPPAHGMPAPVPSYANGTAAPGYAPAAVPAPAAPTGIEAQVAALGAQVGELARELHSRAAPPAAAAPPPAASNENILVAMINAQAQTSRDFQVQMQAAAARESENMRTMMTAMLNQRGVEAKPAADPTAGALAIVKAARELAQPAPSQPPMADTIASFKALKEISAPAAPAAPGPAQSELSEIVGGITALIQAETSKAAVASVTEQAKPAPPERPPRPRNLWRIPGWGVVDVVEPEPPMPPPASLSPRTASWLDTEAIKRDPALRARVLAELGIDASAATAAPQSPPAVVAPPPAPPTPIAPAPTPTAPVPAPMPTAPPNMAVPTSAAPTVTSAPPVSSAPPAPPVPHEANIDAILSDPALRAHVLKALATAERGEAPPVVDQAATVVPNAPVAVEAPRAVSEVSPPTAAPPVSSERGPSAVLTEQTAPAPSTAQPTTSAATHVATRPMPTASPIAAPPEPPTPAASDDQRAPVAEPTETAARGSPVVTEEYRTRAVPSLRTIAGMPRAQQRAVLSTLPGLEDEEEVNKLLEFFQVAASMPPELWVNMTAGLPADTVRVLVDGPGG